MKVAWLPDNPKAFLRLSATPATGQMGFRFGTFPIIVNKREKMKRVRPSKQMEAELEEATRISGESVSSIIRRAVQDRCRSILGDRLDTRVIDVAGTIQSKGGRARRSGRAFAESLLQRRGGGS